MAKTFKPMLATQVDNLEDIQYPAYFSYKLDGIRCVIKNGVALSRSLKPIPNKHIQEWAKVHRHVLEGLDGEFIVGNPCSPTVFRDTTSFVMSHDKVQDFDFYVFDIDTADTADVRLKTIEDLKLRKDIAIVLEQVPIGSAADAEKFRTKAVAAGYEGAMAKKIKGLYKYGRSSLKEGLLLKLKLFKDEEFKIVGYECKYHNSNEATTNELGRTARSTKKEGMLPLDTLGVLYLETKDGKEFGVGSGFDDKTRDELWAIRETLPGKYATIKYFEIGGYDVPRFGVFKAIRNPIDIVKE
jgi:DNA ligase-1